MGQVFDGLDYLREHGWVHGHIDRRRSILVMKDTFLVPRGRTRVEKSIQEICSGAQFPQPAADPDTRGYLVIEFVTTRA